MNKRVLLAMAFGMVAGNALAMQGDIVVPVVPEVETQEVVEAPATQAPTSEFDRLFDQGLQDIRDQEDQRLQQVLQDGALAQLLQREQVLEEQGNACIQKATGLEATINGEMGYQPTGAQRRTLLEAIRANTARLVVVINQLTGVRTELRVRPRQ